MDRPAVGGWHHRPLVGAGGGQGVAGRWTPMARPGWSRTGRRPG